jgi:hypothetical protein
MGFGGSKLKIKEGTPYTQIRDTLKPLDVVFFSGGDFISAIIKHEERLQLDQTTKKRMAMPGAFSHMGIVVNSDILDHPNVKKGEMYIFESTIGGYFGVDIPNVDGRIFYGVQLRNLDKIIPAYDKPDDNRIAISRLAAPAPDSPKTKQRFTAFFNKYNGTVYEFSILDLAATLFSSLRVARDEFDSLSGANKLIFCSELVAMVYKDLEILGDDVIPQNIAPMDFIGYGDDNPDTKKSSLPIILDKPQYIVSDLHSV